MYFDYDDKDSELSNGKYIGSTKNQNILAEKLKDALQTNAISHQRNRNTRSKILELGFNLEFLFFFWCGISLNETFAFLFSQFLKGKKMKIKKNKIK